MRGIVSLQISFIVEADNLDDLYQEYLDDKLKFVFNELFGTGHRINTATIEALEFDDDDAISFHMEDEHETDASTE